MKCLVTGATGFIGSSLCFALQQRGDSLVALSRGGEHLPNGLATLAHDLCEPAVPQSLFEAIDTVFHLAGIAHQQAAESAYERVNTQATLALARQAELAGVRCFIFLSSVKAMGPAIAGAARAEADVHPATDHYGRSKWRAEQVLREAFRESPMSIVILRPALVVAPQAKGNLELLTKAVRFGLPRPPQAGSRSMLVREDLIRLMLLLADNPPPGTRTWIACHEQPHSTRELYDALRVAAGKDTGIAWLPAWCWYGALALIDRMRRAAGNGLQQRLFGDECYSSAAVTAATGWQAAIEPAAAICGSAKQAVQQV